MHPPVHIGQKETVSLPLFGIRTIEAKVDTGAYNSAISSRNVELIERGGQQLLRFGLLSNGNEGSLIMFETHEFDFTTVKSSNGIAEQRYLIKTKLALGGKIYKINLTLANRAEMRYPI